jgi:hypothetical protein
MLPLCHLAKEQLTCKYEKCHCQWRNKLRHYMDYFSSIFRIDSVLMLLIVHRPWSWRQRASETLFLTHLVCEKFSVLTAVVSSFTVGGHLPGIEAKPVRYMWHLSSNTARTICIKHRHKVQKLSYTKPLFNECILKFQRESKEVSLNGKGTGLENLFNLLGFVRLSSSVVFNSSNCSLLMRVVSNTETYHPSSERPSREPLIGLAMTSRQSVLTRSPRSVQNS